MSVEYSQVSNINELRQVLALQKINQESAITAQESKSQGFVTINHTLEVLERMNTPHGHIIAKNVAGEVIGYCLVMLETMHSDMRILTPLIQKINQLTYRGHKLIESDYFIMGQVCIAKDFRGQGVFEGLYRHMEYCMSPHFDFIITSIAKRNTRSIRAHQKVGFQVIDEYIDDTEDDWVVVIWDI